jgi:hypothetical protein
MRRLVLVLLALLVALPALGQESQATNPRFRRPATAGELSGGGGVAEAIAIAETLSEGSTTNAVSYQTTGTFTLASNRLGLCWVVNTDGDDGPDAPTGLTQTGQTWVEISTIVDPQNDIRATLYRTLGAGADAATVTVDFPADGDNQTGAILLCQEVANVDISGTNGSGAILQIAALGAQNTLGIGGLSFNSRTANSAVLLGAGANTSCAWAPESGYTAGTEAGYATPTTEGQVFTVVGGSDTTPSVTLSACGTSPEWAAIAIEVKASLTSDVGVPTVAIDAPTSASSYETSTAAFAFSGTADDNVAVTAVTWECTTGTCTPDSGTATGTTAWSVTGVTLPCDADGETVVITVTASDGTNTAMDPLTVTCTTPDLTNPTGQILGPTSSPTIGVASAAQTISGIAADDTALQNVTWACPECDTTSGTATGTTNWTFAVSAACSGGGTANVVTVTFRDTSNNTSTDVITVTCTSGDVTNPVITITTDCGGGEGANCTVATSPQNIGGTASDAVGVTLVTGSCPTCSPTTFTATGTVNWSFTGLGLSASANTITMTARDAAGNTGTDSIVMTRSAAVEITTTSCPQAQATVSYGGCTLNATGGTTPYTWSEVGTTLATDPECDGLSFMDSGNTGIFSGTATTTGTCGPITVQVSDDNAVTDTQDITIFVVAAGAETAHQYFDALVATGLSTFADSQSAGRSHAHTLRSTASIEAVTAAGGVSNSYFTYDFSGDTYPDKQDAMKFVKPKDDPASTSATDGKVIFTGTAGSTVTSGVTLTRASDGRMWTTTQSGTIAAGTTTVVLKVVSTGVGPDYEAVAGTALTFAPIAGIASAVVDKAGVTLTNSDSISGNQQLRMPIGIAHTSGDTILAIWDWYYGQEFRQCIGAVNNYKIFNIRSSTGSTTSGSIHIGSKIRFVGVSAADDVGSHMNTLVPGGSGTQPTGMTQSDNLIPTGAGAAPRYTYMKKWGTWTRHILEVRTNVLGSHAVFDAWKSQDPTLDYTTFNATTWNAISEWVLDENRDAVRVMYRVPWKQTDSHLAHLNFEMNTSTVANSQTCDLVGYGRNAIILRNYATNVAENDTTIFRKPVR